MAPKVEICYMGNEMCETGAQQPESPPEIVEGCYQNLLERFRWHQQHDEYPKSDRDSTVPYREQ